MFEYNLNVQIMRYFLLIFLLFFINSSLFSQKYKPFEGTIFYDVYLQASPDSLPKRINYLTLHIKDSLVRVDTNSENFGGQSTIKNSNRKRAYILLKSNDQFYAIRHILTDSASKDFSFKKLNKKAKLDGFQIKSVKRISATGEIDTIYYFPKINPVYLNIFSGIKGLPAEYRVPVNEKAFLIYQAIRIEEKELDPKLFSIPNFFKIITFDEFILLQGK